ncbi:MAG: hypothetical protein JW769_02085 [Parachlamydiales bacterium]|nr:hypothetical protein [Parachlamydiales bacterium]
MKRIYLPALCGARAAKVLWKDKTAFQENETFSLFYNGRGYFVDADKKDNIKILAVYDERKECAAIVECQVGLGKAILSGVHFEYDYKILDPNDPYLIPIRNELEKEDNHHMQLIRHLLERLNLHLAPKQMVH